MNHNKLNSKIYPIYGKYKESLGKIAPVNSLQYWSKIGKYIDHYLKENKDISKTKLFRDLYGKSEGADNIGSRGYIAREFLGRAHRLYLMENNNIIDIKRDLSKINSISPFREAMPFFDNKKYMFKGKKKKDLLELLNSSRNSSELVDEVRLLQKKYIKKSNPRTQRLSDLKSEVKLFIDSYNSIYEDIKENNFKDYKNEDSENIILISSYLQCLTAEEFIIPNESIKSFNNQNLNNIKKIVDHLFEKKHAKVRRRFRRLIPVNRIMQISEYIASFESEISFNRFRSTLNF